MAKVYGNRWEGVNGNLGQGGQGMVIPVVDRHSGSLAQYALKRVLNPRRHDRFRTEVEAIKRLAHPNIIPLLDHSALDAAPNDAAKQFIVMPIARGGDLAASAVAFQGDLSRTINIGVQAAEALHVAHSASVVHRDVKPENILLSGEGDHIWVTDFGICLIDDGRDRITPQEEVVGPAVFMAPELEGGGQLDVTPAADVYSLGKVLYFLFTGGSRLPRENLGEERYAAPLRAPGLEGFRLLLHQMIAPLDARLKSMDVVLKRLIQIQEALAPKFEALSEAGLRSLDEAKSAIAQAAYEKSSELEKRQLSERIFEAAVGALSATVYSQDEAGSAAMRTEGAINATAQDVSGQYGRLQLGSRVMLVRRTVELLYQKATRPDERVWALQFHILQKSSFRSEPSLAIMARLEWREANGKPLKDCSAWLRRETYSGKRHTYFVTNTSPLILEISPDKVADEEPSVREFVRDTVSALPELASKDFNLFVPLMLGRGSRRR